MFILLADSELELVPEEMQVEACVRGAALSRGKDASEMLLDNYLMREAILKHNPLQLNRIGFPHISYLFHVLNSESILSGSIHLEYAIHTKNNIVIEGEELRQARKGFDQFRDVVEKLLAGESKKSSLIDYLDRKGALDNSVVLHPNGGTGLITTDRLNYIIGGFPQGDFISDLGPLRLFSLYQNEITVPAVVELLHSKLISQVIGP